LRVRTFLCRNLAFAPVLVSMLAAAPAFAADRFETRLSPSPLTDGTRVNIAGEGHAAAVLDGNLLTVSGDFHGLKSNASTAQLYFGIVIGGLGPKAFDLTVTQGTGGAISGSFKLSAAQAAGVRSGKFYVQINSEKAPDGNLIGWLLPPHPFPGEDVPEPGHGFLPQLDVPQH
jgi:CHRD domain